MVLPRLSAAAAGTNSSPPQSGFVEVSSDDFESRTNVSVFRGNVRVVDAGGGNEPGRLSCGILTVISPGKDEAFERLTAEENVVTEQGSSRTTSAKLVYTKAGEAAELTGNPAWKTEQREGRADVLQFDLAKNVMRGQGHAFCKLSRAGEAQPIFLLAQLGRTTNAPAASAATGRTEISSDEYTIQRDAAVFTGHVRADDFQAEQLRGHLSGGKLTATISTASNQIEEVLAEQDVIVEQTPDTARGANAVLQRLACGSLAMRVDPATGRVGSAVASSRVIVEHGDMTGRGEKATYRFEQDQPMIELTGGPVLQARDWLLTNAESVVWNLMGKTARARGPWKISPPPGSKIGQAAAPVARASGGVP
jgi:lipopolysaccharide export system protein LptA